MSKLSILLVVLVCAFPAFGQSQGGPEITEGSLFAYGKDGKELGDCPLKSTKVSSDISGFIARVRVRQEFENSFTSPIEAVYTFPLSQKGAVDDMTMTIGTRVIRGKIMKRDEARQVYEQAKSEGKTASLLDQERPNIFTQSVANIMPGDKVVIEISYVETLKYEDGAYEFVFPMTVGPRYIPSTVKDAAKIKPPYAATRNGSDISVEVNLNAGVPIEGITSTSHDITQVNFSPVTSKITLRDEKTIPNKDFILRYDVTGGKIQDAVMTHRDERGGFFTLILQPPDKIANEDRTPKEIVFVLDTSGSMSGFPIEKAKEAMKMSLEGLYPDDTFNLITFAGDTSILFDGPVPATAENLAKAKAFLESRQGGGGTEMMKAIKASLDPSNAKDHLRIVCFMTDGYVGNEEQIIAEVQRHPQARVFSFGIGSSVNRYLLDKMAEAGRGEVEYVSLTDDGSKAARRFYERVRTPLLTDLSIDWNGLPVADVYPSKLTDLFSAKPVVVHGRYKGVANGVIKLRGLVAGQPYERQIALNLPETDAANDSLAGLWARARIDELSSDKLRTANVKAADIEQEITNLALEFRLMTNFTSFVAVEDVVVNQSGKLVTTQVPVQMPEGVSRAMTLDGTDKEGFITNYWKRSDATYIMQSGADAGGGGGGGRSMAKRPVNKKSMSRGVLSSNGTGSGGGTGSGYGSGSGSGSGSGTAVARLESPSLILAPASTQGNLAYRSGLPPAAEKDVSPLRILSKPRATFTEQARTNNIQGSVTLKVTLLANGQIGDITPVTRLPYGLTEQAIEAAKQIKFEPKTINEVPVSVVTVFQYNFSGHGSEAVIVDESVVNAAPTTEANALSSAEEQKQKLLMSRLHTWLYSLVTRLATPGSLPSEDEKKFVRDGKANVNVRLSITNAAVLEKLRAAGLEITSEKGVNVSGRIQIEKLAVLAEIWEVKLILPVI